MARPSRAQCGTDPQSTHKTKNVPKQPRWLARLPHPARAVLARTCSTLLTQLTLPGSCDSQGNAARSDTPKNSEGCSSRALGGAGKALRRSQPRACVHREQAPPSRLPNTTGLACRMQVAGSGTRQAFTSDSASANSPAWCDSPGAGTRPARQLGLVQSLACGRRGESRLSARRRWVQPDGGSSGGGSQAAAPGGGGGGGWISRTRRGPPPPAHGCDMPCRSCPARPGPQCAHPAGRRHSQAPPPPLRPGLHAAAACVELSHAAGGECHAAGRWGLREAPGQCGEAPTGGLPLFQ